MRGGVRVDQLLSSSWNGTLDVVVGIRMYGVLRRSREGQLLR